jgi:hypothetical protein
MLPLLCARMIVVTNFGSPDGAGSYKKLGSDVSL